MIYAYFKKEERIVMIELYHKNDKENEDKGRVKKHFKEGWLDMSYGLRERNNFSAIAEAKE